MTANYCHTLMSLSTTLPQEFKEPIPSYLQRTVERNPKLSQNCQISDSPVKLKKQKGQFATEKEQRNLSSELSYQKQRCLPGNSFSFSSLGWAGWAGLGWAWPLAEQYEGEHTAKKRTLYSALPPALPPGRPGLRPGLATLQRRTAPHRTASGRVRHFFAANL
jgi:hypothetical protein